MTPELPAWRVERHAQLPSTQDELKARLEAGADVHGLVIRADSQSAARGQRRRDWLSGTGGSWQSAALRCPLVPAATLFIGIHVADALNARLPGAPLRLKWPNDLLQDGRKTAGILCEYSSGHLVAGVGVNVANEVPDGATRLSGLDPETVHGLVLEGIRRGVMAMLEEPETLEADFARLDAFRGRRLSGGGLEGEAAGVTPDGRLRLLTAEGVTLLSSAAGLRAG